MIQQTEIDAARAVLEREKNAFYDGPDDPAVSAAVAYGEDLDRRIAEAGGLEAWRIQGVAVLAVT